MVRASALVRGRVDDEKLCFSATKKKFFLPFVDYREQVAGINLSREKIS